MQWIPVQQNVADALTKISRNIFRTLYEIMKDGKLPEVVLSSSERSIGTMAWDFVDIKVN